MVEQLEMFEGEIPIVLPLGKRIKPAKSPRAIVVDEWRQTPDTGIRVRAWRWTSDSPYIGRVEETHPRLPQGPVAGATTRKGLDLNAEELRRLARACNEAAEMLEEGKG